MRGHANDRPIRDRPARVHATSDLGYRSDGGPPAAQPAPLPSVPNGFPCVENPLRRSSSAKKRPGIAPAALLSLRGRTLLAGLIDNRFRAVDDLVPGRNCEEGWVGLSAHDIGQPEDLLAHAGVAPLAVDDRLELR